MVELWLYDALVNRVTMWNVAERQIRVKGPMQRHLLIMSLHDATKIAIWKI